MVLLIAWLACSGDAPETPVDSETVAEDTSATGDSAAPQVVGFDDVLLRESELVPTVHTLEWTSPDPLGSWVEVADDAGTWATPRGAVTTTHSHVVLGLKAGERVTLVPVHEDATGAVVRGNPIERVVPSAPAEMPQFRVTQPVPDPAAPQRFWTMLYFIGGRHSYAVIIDQDGDPVWWVSSPAPTDNLLMAKPSLDGRSVLTAHFRGQDPGIRRTPLGAMSAEEQTFTPTVEAHHDFAELPDGRLAYLAHVFEPLAWGGYGPTSVQLDVVWEIDEGAVSADDAVERFHPLSIDLEPAPVCSHSEPLELASGVVAQWGHANSLLWDGRDDTFVINFRNLDTVMKVDRGSGQRVWSIGGLSNDFTPSQPDLWFDHGHFSQWSPDGFTMFSNELHHGESRLFHYGIDEAGRTVELLWSYDQPDGVQVPALGDVDRTEDGAYLAAWGNMGVLERITAAGEVSWRATSVPGVTVARASWLVDLYDVSRGAPLEP